VEEGKEKWAYRTATAGKRLLKSNLPKINFNDQNDTSNSTYDVYFKWLDNV
jgi:hypothetical protein